MFLALLNALALSAPVYASPIVGTPGHIKIELKTPSGWVELYQPAYQLQQARRTLSLPAELAQKGLLTLRLSPVDNDETQIDYLALDGGKLLSAKDLSSGQDLRAKFKAADRDVAEIHGSSIEAVLRAPKTAGELTLVLEARSSNNANIPNTPFRLGAWAVKGAVTCGDGPMLLDAKDGTGLKIETSALATGSGHPSAPLFGQLKVEGQRLRGHLDFGPDNDPGDDDYAAIVAYDAQGKAKEFKVTLADASYGKARWAYAPAPSAAWQHMQFDLDVKLADLPRDKNGKLALELLAYGTCSASGPNADYKASVLSAPGVAVPNNLTWTVTTASNGGGSAATGNLLVTTKLFSPYNVTLSTQTNAVSQNGGSCTFSPALSTFVFNPPCSGTYNVWADAQGTGGIDPVTTGQALTQAVVITGGSACDTPTSTPTPTPTITVSPTSTSTPTPYTPTMTYTPVDTATAGITNAKADSVVITSPRQGDPLVIGFPTMAAGVTVNVAKAVIYNLVGQKVAEINSQGQNLVWQTRNVAPGIYFIKITGTLSDGSSVDTFKKGLVLAK